MLQELKKQEQELLKQRQPHLEEVRKINKTKEENNFIEYYNTMLPSVDNGGVVNRMCKKLEEEFNNILSPMKEGNFNKSILMTDKKVKNSICDELRELYKQYKSDIQSFMKCL